MFYIKYKYKKKRISNVKHFDKHIIDQKVFHLKNIFIVFFNFRRKFRFSETTIKRSFSRSDIQGKVLKHGRQRIRHK